MCFVHSVSLFHSFHLSYLFYVFDLFYPIYSFLGLASYLYTSDMAKGWRVMEALEYGMVGFNEAAISTEVGGTNLRFRV